MNIFATNDCPIESALHHDDKRAIKMTLESAQMLSSAAPAFNISIPQSYKKTHYNHPCSIWARSSINNFFWLLQHHTALAEVYNDVYSKTHLSFTKIGEHIINNYNFDNVSKPSSFCNCTTFKHIPDVHQAYKLELTNKWKNDSRKPTWQKRDIPNFITNN